jgi:FkbM family methyltransferase
LQRLKNWTKEPAFPQSSIHETIVAYSYKMKLFSRIFRKLATLFYKIFQMFERFSRRLWAPPETVCEKNKQIWYSIEGDRNLRVEYALNPNSVVYDVGGFEGNWAAEISARYACRIFVFEPVSSFVGQLNKRFGANNQIRVLAYGLDGADGEALISTLEEASSTYRDEDNHAKASGQKELIRLRAIDAVMTELKTRHIDLIKINIEGGEYGLLECLLDKGLIGEIDNLQIQFHDFVPDAEARMNRIKSRLSATHELTYEYVFVWENWKRKKS